MNPNDKQLKLVSAEGLSRVTYIAFNDNDSATNNEYRKVKTLGMG